MDAKMIEIHGWLSIYGTYKDEDLLSQQELENIHRQIQGIIQDNRCGIKIQYKNGSPFLNTLHCSNHHTFEVDEIIKAYTMIAKIASGSYGMLYLRDDEDKEHWNEFQVYIFKKGSCIRQIDNHFSPCIPTIEEDI